jgi:hypothetical protein
MTSLPSTNVNYCPFEEETRTEYIRFRAMVPIFFCDGRADLLVDEMTLEIRHASLWQPIQCLFNSSVSRR